jgi:hypothetical protein
MLKIDCWKLQAQNMRLKLGWTTSKNICIHFVHKDFLTWKFWKQEWFFLKQLITATYRAGKRYNKRRKKELCMYKCRPLICLRLDMVCIWGMSPQKRGIQAHVAKIWSPMQCSEVGALENRLTDEGSNLINELIHWQIQSMNGQLRGGKICER